MERGIRGMKSLEKGRAFWSVVRIMEEYRFRKQRLGKKLTRCREKEPAISGRAWRRKGSITNQPQFVSESGLP